MTLYCFNRSGMLEQSPGHYALIALLLSNFRLQSWALIPCQEYICRKSAESKSGRDDSSRMIKGGGVRISLLAWKEDVTQQK